MSLDTGDTAFMLVATALVMIMTPGLAFFYGGLVSRKRKMLLRNNKVLKKRIRCEKKRLIDY